MELEITSTPRETLVWATSPHQADQLRTELSDAGFLVRDADPWELDNWGRIPQGEHLEFDPARIFNVAMGVDANASLQALVDSGHTLVWHRWQPRPARMIWGVPVKIRPHGYSRAHTGSAGATESAVHFGIPVRATRGLGLRLTRDTYARINKKSSMPRSSREMDPERWDRLSEIYEDEDHRIHTDAWCAEHQIRALKNFDINMTHFASLDAEEFEQALQQAIAGHVKLSEVTDLSKWAGLPGLYMMVLDEYRQVYVGATDQTGGVMARIKQHWAGTQSFDRLIWGDVETSILSIDSFRALDTTRIFAVKTSTSFVDENPVLELMPEKFTLNRVRGGRETIHLAAVFGVGAVTRRREPS